MMHPRRFAALTGALVVSASGVAVAQQATAPVVVEYPPYPGDPAGKTQRVTLRAAGVPGGRTFDFTTTAPQREGDPQQRTVREPAGAPYVVSGNTLFDALFALALDDARQASVAQIKDGSYNGDQPIDCPCFETGAKWHYVWTRDLSYALDLGLAQFDPERAAASLLFKTSAFRAGFPVPPELPAGSRQIIQDTGSGGSWPISTDRAVWALGAEQALATLRGPARATFARQAYDALRGTVEADRVAAFDVRDGLYGGEHSFLDWREQTYAPWIVDALPWMAQSKGLSTNVVQLLALSLASRLGRELGDSASAARYAAWGDALAPAIDRAFWDAEAGLYATFTTADRFPARIAKYDLLGNALAIAAGLTDTERARTILSRYPFAPAGPPVVWPQAPGEHVYHNRAVWPFVTAYALRAAAMTGHVEAADAAMESLMQGAALHLSNMENLEWLTGQSQFDDGPTINSRRQLWSVGGYLGAVTTTLFGWRTRLDDVVVRPFVTARMRSLLTGSSPRLSGLRYKGREIEITLRFPAAGNDAAHFEHDRVTLNGAAVNGSITEAMLREGRNRVEVTMRPATAARRELTRVPQVPALSHDDARVFMPWTPQAQAKRDEDNGVALSIAARDDAQRPTHRVYRDGRLVARDVATTTWHDPSPPAPSATACYSVVAVHAETGLASQPSAPSCVMGTASVIVEAADPRMSGAALVPPGDGVARATRRVSLGTTLRVADIEIVDAGAYAIAAEYDNHIFALNTGVTNAVKRLTLVARDGTRQQAIVSMPHIRPVDGTHPIRQSTRAYMTLAPGRYTLELTDFFNMSALEANASYTGPGGRGGPVNEARVAAITIDRLPDE